MSERAAGSRQGPGGHWYAPLTGSVGPDHTPGGQGRVRFAELAAPERCTGDQDSGEVPTVTAEFTQPFDAFD